MTAPPRPNASLKDGPVGVLRAIGFVAVPILLLALLVGTLGVLVNSPV
jgi:hypothetical protein